MKTAANVMVACSVLIMSMLVFAKSSHAEPMTEELLANSRYEIPDFLADCFCKTRRPCLVKLENGECLEIDLCRDGFSPISLVVEKIVISDVDSDGLNDAFIVTLANYYQGGGLFLYYSLGNGNGKVNFLEKFNSITNIQINAGVLTVQAEDYFGESGEKTYRFALRNGRFINEDVEK